MPSLTPGQRIEKYRLVRKIGAGGMGEVWEVLREDISQRGALKVMTATNLQNHPSLLQRFINEARAANQIKHPGIPQVFDFGSLEDQTPFLVMEFMDGESLDGRIQSAARRPRHCLDLDESLWIGDDVASALIAAHAKGIVHRDLKPSNIMLCPDPTAQRGERAHVLDFGVAKLHDGEHLTKSGAALGTYLYMAPEQFKNAAEVDGRADVYSLALILFQCLCGRLPFRSDLHSPYALMSEKLFDSLIPLAQYAPMLPQEILTLVETMLAREPGQRPTMGEVQVALRHSLGEPLPRQTGAYAVTAAPPQPRAVTEALSESLEPTGDVPANVIEAATAAPSTPSGEKIAGELSPRDIPVPSSLSSMPSLPVPMPPLRAAPEAYTAGGAPTPLPISVLATPSEPTTREAPHSRRGSGIAALLAGSILVSICAAVALWPAPQRQSKPVQQAEPVAAPAVKSPPPPSPPAPSITAPPEPTGIVTPPPAQTASAANKPESPAVETPPIVTRKDKAPSATRAPARGCTPRLPSESCILTAGLSTQQRDTILKAFKQTDTRFCGSERLVLGGLPAHPTLLQSPPSLSRDKSVFLLALRGLLSDGTLPRQVELSCKER